MIGFSCGFFWFLCLDRTDADVAAGLSARLYRGGTQSASEFGVSGLFNAAVLEPGGCMLDQLIVSVQFISRCLPGRDCMYLGSK